MKIHDVEQNTPEWLALRLGKPTASCFSKIITSKGAPSGSMSTYAVDLANELFAGESVDAFEGNVWTERGKEKEAEAISLYEFSRGVVVLRVGFITDDDDRFGASPDGLVGENGMVEIKCLKGNNHTKAILFHDKHGGKCPSTYVQQTQGQIWLAAKKWCDLVFYSPKLPLLVIRQYPDPDLQKALAEELPKLIEERDRVLEVLRGI